ncbi:MAG: hypothetical protein Ct9H300mP20_07050 [Gammaproteobacteria bacterium]|nr:MAG: hypothetical protein Ct9H300mP20_07050 [Gammaproteobacteria bacterium]
MKRVVTGHDENGKAIFVKIGEPEHVVDTPGGFLEGTLGYLPRRYYPG